ncbi:GNAT family N-acetyltransferase [Dapis sp. BLCC M126]|uniref:GNAT family N-acetyltransferase n=1 Tax=Dapis sp. BLCC M126 TaxID=3400189 RepID=UPI003CE83596
MTASTPLVLHQGRSLILRRTLPEDAPLLFEQMYNNPEFMRLFRLNDRVETQAQLTERLTRDLKIDPAKSRYLELLMIHQTQGPIGMVSLVAYSSLHRRAELLLGLFNDVHRGHIYGPEGSLLVTDLAFNQYNLHRLYAYVYQYNQAPQKILPAVGFTLEGVLREHIFDLTSQTFVDLHLYGMTLTEFRENKLIARLSKRFVGRDITQPPPIATQAKSEKPVFVQSGQIKLRN